MWRQWEEAGITIKTVEDLWSFISDCYLPAERYEESFGDWLLDQFFAYMNVSTCDDGLTLNNPALIDWGTVITPQTVVQSGGSSDYLLVEEAEVPTGGSYSLLTRGTTFRPTFHLSHNTVELDTCPEWMQREMNWSFVPEELLFLKTKRCLPNEPLFFGMELEASTKLSRQEIQYIVTKVEPEQEAFFFFKSDSSISGRYDVLTEIVTMPMTVRYAKRAWSLFFRKLEQLAAAKGKEVKDYFDVSTELTNGLHIHLSKAGFDAGEYSLESHKKRFVTAWNLWDRESQEFYQKISKRRELPRNSTYFHTHPRMDGYTLARRLSRGTGITTRNDGEMRHSTCHETSKTVELRVFQGVFDLNHILACIDVTKATFDFARECPISKFNRHYTSKFKHWLSCQPGFKHAKEAVKCV